jgi:6-phosphogluconolactonase (cycloisomerase 2 family)
VRYSLSAFAMASILGMHGVHSLAATPTFTVTATVAGLTPNSGLVLQDGTDVLPVSAAGTVTFPTPLPSGSSYNVSVAQVPGNPVQYCTVTNGSGLISSTNVTAPRVTCAVRYGRFAYTVGSASDPAISIFGLSAAGQWQHRGYQPTSGLATAVRVFPSQQWVYATTTPSGPEPANSFVPGTLTAYQIDGTTGRLTAINSAGTDQDPQAIEFDPQGRFAFVACGPTSQSSSSLDSFTIDPRSGKVTSSATQSFPPQQGNPTKLVVDPTGQFLFAMFQHTSASSTQILVFAINQSNATLTLSNVIDQRNTTGGSLIPVDLQFDPAGRLLYVLSTPDTITTYRIDPSVPGGLTSVSSFSAGATSGFNSPASIAIDPASEFAYVLNSTGQAPQAGTFNQVSIFSIDPKSGALIPTGSPSIASAFALDSVQVDPSGNFLEIASASAEVSNQATSFEMTTFPINRSSGQLTGTTGSSGLLLPANTTETRGFQAEGVLASFSLARGSSPAAPIGRFAYVTNNVDQNISTFGINGSSGVLTALTTTSTGSTPDFVALDPLGLTAYVSSNNTNVLSEFSVDPTSGTLHPVGTATGFTGPAALVVDPTGRFAYVSESNSIEGFSGTTALPVVTTDDSFCKPITGGGINVGIQCGVFDGLVIDPTGRFLFAINPDDQYIATFSIDSNSGSLTLISVYSTVNDASNFNTPPGLSPFSGVVDPSGRFLYAIDSTADEVVQYTISPTGSLSPTFPGAASVGTPGLNDVVMAIDPSGRFAYVVSATSQLISMFTVDPQSGALASPKNSVTSTGARSRSLSIDPSGKFLYLTSFDANMVLTFRINPSSGALTNAASTPAGSGPFSIATTGTTP